MILPTRKKDISTRLLANLLEIGSRLNLTIKKRYFSIGDHWLTFLIWFNHQEQRLTGICHGIFFWIVPGIHWIPFNHYLNRGLLRFFWGGLFMADRCGIYEVIQMMLSMPYDFQDISMELWSLGFYSITNNGGIIFIDKMEVIKTDGIIAIILFLTGGFLSWITGD